MSESLEEIESLPLPFRSGYKSKEVSLLSSETKIVGERYIEDLEVTEQLPAATCLENDVYVEAGPGTGKTRTLLGNFFNRLLINNDISKFLILSFTKNACLELQDRISKILGAGALDRMDICTIHSFVLRILNKRRSLQNKSPYNPIEKESLHKKVLKYVLKRNKVNFDKYLPYEDEILSYIERVNYEINIERKEVCDD